MSQYKLIFSIEITSGLLGYSPVLEKGHVIVKTLKCKY